MMQYPVFYDDLKTPFEFTESMRNSLTHVAMETMRSMRSIDIEYADSWTVCVIRMDNELQFSFQYGNCLDDILSSPNDNEFGWSLIVEYMDK